MSAPIALRLVRVAAVLLAALALCTALALTTATPSHATEGEAEKVALPENPHDQVGLVILGVAGVIGGVAALNAWKQLRGERPQADGKIRWR